MISYNIEMKIKKPLLSTLFFCLVFLLNINIVSAFEISKLGIHILNTTELNDAKKLVTPQIDFGLGQGNILGVDTNFNSDLDEMVLPANSNWSYVTIPLTLDDLTKEKEIEWQLFFNEAKDLKIIPIVRLVSRYSSENKSWIVPNKKQIIDQINFLSKLNWPTDKRYIIAYNEVNHASEWGGRVDPEEYVNILEFFSNWAHTEEKNYMVLPAAMDLAAPNGKVTLEAFNYLSQMYNYDPEVFSYIDIWNSHSYPNPGFSSSPTRYGQNSLRGFQYELDFLKLKTGEDYKVMITETGWKKTPSIENKLSSYYLYAMQHIWSDDRVIAVTPFLLKGSPGPFANFSFYDVDNNPTNQFYAFKDALGKISEI